MGHVEQKTTLNGHQPHLTPFSLKKSCLGPAPKPLTGLSTRGIFSAALSQDVGFKWLLFGRDMVNQTGDPRGCSHKAPPWLCSAKQPQHVLHPFTWLWEWEQWELGGSTCCWKSCRQKVTAFPESDASAGWLQALWARTAASSQRRAQASGHLGHLLSQDMLCLQILRLLTLPNLMSF